MSLLAYLPILPMVYGNFFSYFVLNRHPASRITCWAPLLAKSGDGMIFAEQRWMWIVNAHIVHSYRVWGGPNRMHPAFHGHYDSDRDRDNMRFSDNAPIVQDWRLTEYPKKRSRNLIRFAKYHVCDPELTFVKVYGTTMEDRSPHLCKHLLRLLWVRNHWTNDDFTDKPTAVEEDV